MFCCPFKTKTALAFTAHFFSSLITAPYIFEGYTQFNPQIHYLKLVQMLGITYNFNFIQSRIIQGIAGRSNKFQTVIGKCCCFFSIETCYYKFTLTGFGISCGDINKYTIAVWHPNSSSVEACGCNIIKYGRLRFGYSCI